MYHNKLWKMLQKMEISDQLTWLLRNLQVKKQQLELDIEQRTGIKLGKGYIKAVYCQQACFTHMQSLVRLVQSLSHIRLFGTPWTAARQASLSITNSWSLLKLVYCLGDAIQPSHPLSSPSPPTLNFSQHQGIFQ